MNSWNTETTTKRRDKLSIIAEILEIAKDGTLKTQIMYKANLSFAQLGEYLEYMQKTNLLHKIQKKGKDTYAATEKGIDFLQRHYEISELLQDEEQAKKSAKVPPQNLLKRS